MNFNIKEYPLVSIIIPTYKRRVDYLRRAVDSVMSQTYPNIELIVIDDSPKEYQYRDEIKKYMESIVSDSIIYHQNIKNIGGSLARNKGIELANGKYTSFLDDDDEYKSEKIEKQVRFMQKENCDLSFSNMIMYDVHGNIVDYRDYKDIPSFDNSTLLRYHLMKHLTGTPTFMFKTEVLRKIGGFEDAKMGQEFYLMLKSIERGLKIRYLDECDVMVYKHEDGGISQGKNKILGERNLYYFKKQYFNRLSKEEISFINFRHWAVMVVAYKRNNMYFHMLGAGIRAFFSSPLIFCEQVLSFLRKVINVRIQNINN